MLSFVDSIDLPSIEEDAPSSSGDAYENCEKGRPHIFSVSSGKKHCSELHQVIIWLREVV